MSNVYARNQKEHELKFLADALTLMKEVTAFAMNDKNIPKHHRFSIAVPMMKTVQKIVQYLYEANNCFPQLEETDNEEDTRKSLEKAEKILAEREHYQRKAKSNCFYLQSLFVNAEMTVPTVKVKSLQRMSVALTNLIDTILAWTKSNRIYPPKQK